jgi:hypothetical protein
LRTVGSGDVASNHAVAVHPFDQPALGGFQVPGDRLGIALYDTASALAGERKIVGRPRIVLARGAAVVDDGELEVPVDALTLGIHGGDVVHRLDVALVGELQPDRGRPLVLAPVIGLVPPLERLGLDRIGLGRAERRARARRRLPDLRRHGRERQAGHEHGGTEQRGKFQSIGQNRPSCMHRIRKPHKNRRHRPGGAYSPSAAFTRGITCSPISSIDRRASAGSVQSMQA